jgi:hypothetical protein
MNKLTLKRLENFDGDKNVVTYEVTRVVGSVSPFVGEILSLNYVKDLCEQTGVWSVTFV